MKTLLALVALTIGCGGSGEGRRGCPFSGGIVPLSFDAGVPVVRADNCSAFYSQAGRVVDVSTLNGEPCHVSASFHDGGTVLSVTVTFQADSVCPDAYRLGSDASFSLSDAGSSPH